MISSRVLLVVSVVTMACAACAAGEGDDTQASEAAVSSAAVSADDVEAAIASLRAQRDAEPLRPYYADGSRLEGCWRNPAGSKLTDLQKAVYCAMPLELRLCNTPVLLVVDESDVEGRFKGYLACKEKVDAVFAPLGARGMFAYGPEIDEVYRRVYLERAPLAPAEVERIVRTTEPVYSSRPFPLVLAAIGASLAAEARDLALGALASLADAFQRIAGEDPR